MGLKWLADKFQTHHLAVELDIPEAFDLTLSENQTGLFFSALENCS